MNAREQALQKRVAYLEARSNALMMVLDRAIDDIERAESVACAFAWDLVTTHRYHWVGDEVGVTQILCWQRAIEAGK